MILKLESAILAVLREAFPELEVEPFPDRPEEYEFLHPVGSLLLQYDGGSISAPGTLGFTTQMRELNFSVLSLTRNLRDNGGCYDVLERVRHTLLGLKIEGCELMFSTDESFVSEDEGVWIYRQSFCLRAPQVQDMPNYYAQNDFFESPNIGG